MLVNAADEVNAGKHLVNKNLDISSPRADLVIFSTSFFCLPSKFEINLEQRVMLQKKAH